ncbi:extracellular solute-binding protein, partial [Frankia casuarinae]|uniref:extracellular solute-binding protein n=2 Tax=Frankia TaxID=1854 RepID=UPI0036F3EC72
MRFRRMKTAALAVLGAGLLATAGCGGSDGGAAATPSATASSAASGVQGTVKVLAAASLTGSFTQLGKDFEAANPGSKVTFSFAGSSQLAQQITSG